MPSSATHSASNTRFWQFKVLFTKIVFEREMCSKFYSNLMCLIGFYIFLYISFDFGNIFVFQTNAIWVLKFASCISLLFLVGSHTQKLLIGKLYIYQYIHIYIYIYVNDVDKIVKHDITKKNILLTCS